ncbi:SDR family NAD(P)-dependent oxidoreductase [bacterium]|jgi:NAD(P)-dependent dehydrogenase (short-subunit alcohol dehydrogenase family)|nr:SDR family NAD(P)-dependent oxidoreductase [bacterium]
MNTRSKTWFITGCSSGFGRILAGILLGRGDRVIATARSLASIEDLWEQVPVYSSAKEDASPRLALFELDVTRTGQIRQVVGDAIRTMGGIDVLVNNAGYGYVGALEETSPDEIRKVFETNVFGLIEVTRAILPQFRAQKSGHIINLSSVAGMSGTPGASIYNATKFAVEGLSEAWAGELSPFGIRVSIIEPGAFRTDFANRSLRVAPYLPEYAEALAATRLYYETIGGRQPGDPIEAAKAIVKLVEHPNPPLRLPMGKIALARIRGKLEQYQKEMKDWESTILETDYPEFR